jgi:hypothetical protein
VILGEFERRADVDDFIEILEPVQAHEQIFQGDDARFDD